MPDLADEQDDEQDGDLVFTIPQFYARPPDKVYRLRSIQKTEGNAYVCQDEDELTKIVFKFTVMHQGPEEEIVLLFSMLPDQALSLVISLNEAINNSRSYISSKEDSLRRGIKDFIDSPTTPNLTRVEGLIAEVKAVRYGS